MKNFTLILNVVLAIAVAILFFLHFSGKKSGTAGAAVAGVKVESGKGSTIVYFEMDSVENNFEYLKQVRSELRALEQQKTSELSALRNSNKNKFLAYQKEYQEKGKTLTEDELARMNQDLARLDNELKTQEQQKSQELNEESIKRIQDVKKKIEDYLKEYNKDKKYAYILSAPSDNIYLKDSTLNITSEIVKGLNDKYGKKKN